MPHVKEDKTESNEDKKTPQVLLSFLLLVSGFLVVFYQLVWKKSRQQQAVIFLFPKWLIFWICSINHSLKRCCVDLKMKGWTLSLPIKAIDIEEKWRDKKCCWYEKWLYCLQLKITKRLKTVSWYSLLDTQW